MQHMTTAAPSAPERPTFEQIYGEYYAPLVRYTLSSLRGISEDDANDIVADVWVHVWQALPVWQDRGVPIGAWLFSCMRNAIIDRMRAGGLKGVIRLDTDLHDPVDETSEFAVLSVLSDEIMAAVVEVLDERQAELIRLVYIEGWRLTEVAQHYGVTLDAMKKLHRRALGRVRTYLETGTTRHKRGARSA